MEYNGIMHKEVYTLEMHPCRPATQAMMSLQQATGDIHRQCGLKQAEVLLGVEWKCSTIKHWSVFKHHGSDD